MRPSALPPESRPGRTDRRPDRGIRDRFQPVRWRRANAPGGVSHPLSSAKEISAGVRLTPKGWTDLDIAAPSRAETDASPGRRGRPGCFRHPPGAPLRADLPRWRARAPRRGGGRRPSLGRLRRPGRQAFVLPGREPVHHLTVQCGGEYGPNKVAERRSQAAQRRGFRGSRRHHLSRADGAGR